MGTAPYFPQFANEFLADVSGWPIEAVGAYARLQCQAWKDDPVGSLPNDDEVLALKAGVNLVAWRKIRPIVLSLCRTGTDGRVHFPRLRAAFEEHRRYSKSRSENAKQGWEKRRAESASLSPNAYASDVQGTSDANEKDMVCPSSASSSSISSPSSKGVGARAPDPSPPEQQGRLERLAPNLDPFEASLATAKGWPVDTLSSTQYRQVKQVAAQIVAAHNGSATPEIAALLPRYYGDRRWGLSFAVDDWAQVVAFARKGAGAMVGARAPAAAPAEESLSAPRSPAEGAWGRALERLTQALGEDAVRTWFWPIVAEVRDGALCLTAPVVVLDWVRENYADAIGAAMKAAGASAVAFYREEA